MKKLTALLLSLVLVAGIFSGCTGGSGDTGTGAGAAADGDAPTPENPIQLRIHCDYTEDHPTARILAEFIEKVSEGTDGAVEIRAYYAGALGDYTTVFDEVAEGSIDMTFGCNSVTYGTVFNVLTFPYLAGSWESAERVFSKDSYLTQLMEELCADIGITLLSLHCVGAGGLATTKMPTDYDVWGVDHDILVRVANADTVSIPMREMGYRVQGINWSELFTAVQTGVVDGFVGGHPPVCYEQFRDVITHYLQINNFFEVATVAINTDTFAKLSTEQQAVMYDCANWVFEQSLIRGAQTEKEYLQMMADYGIEVIELDEAVLAEFATQCRETVWPQLKDELGDEIYDKLIEAAGEW